MPQALTPGDEGATSPNILRRGISVAKSHSVLNFCSLLTVNIKIDRSDGL